MQHGGRVRLDLVAGGAELAALEERAHAGLGLAHDKRGRGLKLAQVGFETGFLLFKPCVFRVVLEPEVGECLGLLRGALGGGNLKRVGHLGRLGRAADVAGDGGEPQATNRSACTEVLLQLEAQHRAAGEAERLRCLQHSPVRLAEFWTDGPTARCGVVWVEQVRHREVALRERGLGRDELHRLGLLRLGIGRGGHCEVVEHEVGARRITATGAFARKRVVGERLQLDGADARELRADFDEVGVLVGRWFPADENGFVREHFVRRATGGVEVGDVEHVFLCGFHGALRQGGFPRCRGGGGGFFQCRNLGCDGSDAGRDGLALAGGAGVVQFHRRPFELDGAGDFWIGAVSLEFRVVEEGEEAVVVALREGVVFVVVALGAFEGRAKPDDAQRADAVVDLVHARLLRVGAGLDVRGRAAVEAGGDALRLGGVRQHIAGKLLDGELREGHVGVERVDNPVAIRPEVAEVVALEAVGVCVTCVVEPRPGPADAELRGGEEAVHELFNCRLPIADCRLVIPDEGVHLLRSRWEPDEVEREATDEDFRRRFGGWLETFLLEAGEDESVKGITDFRKPGADRFHVSPVLRGGPGVWPFRTLVYPSLDDIGLRLGERFAAIRHHVIMALRKRDAAHEFALRGIAGDDGGGLLEGSVARVEAQFALLKLGVVALEARALQDGENLAGEIHGGCGECGGEECRAKKDGAKKWEVWADG